MIGKRVKLSHAGRKLFAMSPDRRGEIIYGEWPEDPVYRIRWDGNRRASNIHRTYIEPDETPVDRARIL